MVWMVIEMDIFGHDIDKTIIDELIIRKYLRIVKPKLCIHIFLTLFLVPAIVILQIGSLDIISHIRLSIIFVGYSFLVANWVMYFCRFKKFKKSKTEISELVTRINSEYRLHK